MDEALFLSYLDRDHDVLIASGDPRPLHLDLELHLLSNAVEQDACSLSLLKDGLSALALWIVGRPRFEAHGWTISVHEPRLNLFFTGSAREKTVVGRAFHEHLEPQGRNIFYSQTIWPGGETRTSSVDVEGNDIFGMVEQYVWRSEQMRARFFTRDDRAALLWPFPGADRAWIEGVRPEEVFVLEAGGRLKLIAENVVRFRCGCDRERITKVVFEIYKGDAGELFGDERAVEAECPRCGTRHEISRESFEKLRAH